MLLVGGLCQTAPEAMSRIETALSSGRAAEIFGRMVAALGGPRDLLEQPGAQASRVTGHLERLPAEDRRTRAVVEAMRDDEARHRASAIALGAAELPGPLKLGMRAMAKVMTTIAYRV